MITSLGAPLFAALVDLALTFAGSPFDGVLPSRMGKGIGEVAVDAFIWSALPATVAAVALVPYVLQQGTIGWLHAAVAGVVAFTAGAIIFPLDQPASLPVLSFIAGLVALIMRLVLISAGVLRKDAS